MSYEATIYCGWRPTGCSLVTPLLDDHRRGQGKRARHDILFLVHLPASQSPVVLTRARGREEAKRDARPVLGHDPDRYIVSPLTREGAEVHLCGGLGFRAAGRDHYPVPIPEDF